MINKYRIIYISIIAFLVGLNISLSLQPTDEPLGAGIFKKPALDLNLEAVKGKIIEEKIINKVCGFGEEDCTEGEVVRYKYLGEEKKLDNYKGYPQIKKEYTDRDLYQKPNGDIVMKYYGQELYKKENDKFLKYEYGETTIDKYERQIKKITKNWFMGIASADTDTSATNNRDTHLLKDTPTVNAGTDTRLRIHVWKSEDPDEINRGIIDFTMPTVSGTISDIDLYLKQVNWSRNRVGRYLEVHELSRAFVETQATWNVYSTGNNWTTAGGDYTSTVIDSIAFSVMKSVAWRTFGLVGTNATNDMSITWGSDVNLMLKADDETQYSGDDNILMTDFYSRDNASDNPYLEITYTPGGGSTKAPRIPNVLLFN